MAIVEVDNITVKGIQPQEDSTLVNFGPLPGIPAGGNNSITLANNHPSYSAVFALLMASAVNNKAFLKIGLDNSTAPFWTLKYVCMFWN